MAPVVHPGRLLKRELTARKLSANRLSLDIGVPSGRVTDILNGRRSITADTAVRLGHYFGTAHNSGSTCRANMTSASSSGEGREDREAGEAGGRDVGQFQLRAVAAGRQIKSGGIRYAIPPYAFENAN